MGRIVEALRSQDNSFELAACFRTQQELGNKIAHKNRCIRVSGQGMIVTHASQIPGFQWMRVNGDAYLGLQRRHPAPGASMVAAQVGDRLNISPIAGAIEDGCWACSRIILLGRLLHEKPQEVQ